MQESPGIGAYIQQHWLRAGAVLAVLVAIGAFLALSSGDEMESAADGQEDVRILSGGVHTVYHSTAALPTGESPRPDGRATLIWFSATWCTTCASMDAFAAAVLTSFEDRVAVVEKSIDHDRTSVDRYAIRGTPTFLLIDAEGREVGRFHHKANANAFAEAISEALAKL